MIKRALQSVLIFLGIVSIVPLCYLIGYFARYSWMILPAGDGQASATTWLDSNANGIKDPDEKNLPNVCVWSAYSPEGGTTVLDPCENSYTDQQGGWGEFLPGGSCDEVFVFAQPPDGFHPTTDLVSGGCDAEFGFVENSVPISHKVMGIGEYIQQRSRVTLFQRICIGLVVVVIGVLGTIWLEKPPKGNE